ETVTSGIVVDEYTTIYVGDPDLAIAPGVEYDPNLKPGEFRASRAYPDSGTYNVTLVGYLDGVGSERQTVADMAAVDAIVAWGTNKAYSASHALANAVNATFSVQPPPSVWDYSYFFLNAASFNDASVGSWNMAAWDPSQSSVLPKDMKETYAATVGVDA